MYGNKREDSSKQPSGKNPNRVTGGIKGQGVDHIVMVSEDGLENQVSYIATWLKKLKSNPKMIIQAGSKAQRAMDYILGTTFDYDDKKEVKKDE